MKWMLAAACTAAISLTYVPVAQAKGCIKGAIVGGVAGQHGGTRQAGCCSRLRHRSSRSEQERPERRERPGPGARSEAGGALAMLGACSSDGG